MAAAEQPGPTSSRAPRKKKDRTHTLYIAVIIAVVAGAVLGLVAPEVGVALKPVGTGFIALIKMMIAPVIFCTIVLGVGSIAKAATVGKVGGMALAYFIAMSTFALAIGLGIDAAPDILQFVPQLLRNIFGSSLVVSFLIVFVLNLIIPKDDTPEN